MNAYLTLVLIPDPAASTIAPGTVNVPAVGQVWTLLPANNVVGRDPTPDVLVVLPWINVSRRHAEIELFENNLWEIVDRQSRNGTYVNGQLLEKGNLTPLLNGDRIRIGDIELVFSSHLDPVLPPDAVTPVA